MGISDWSSDVCSSDLHRRRRAERAGRARPQERSTLRDLALGACRRGAALGRAALARILDRSRYGVPADRKSVVSGKSVSVRVDLGGRRIITKNQKKRNNERPNII